MQYQDSKKWRTTQLNNSVLLLLGLLSIWFLPFTHTTCQSIDAAVFSILNQSLLYSKYWQLLWGYLNHPNETWLNIVFMAAVNILGIFTVPKAKRARAAVIVIYCWLTFQIVLFVTHKIFSDWLELQRFSPSVVIQPWVILSEALNISDIKVYSHSSFPAGHVLVLVFWFKFIQLYAKPWVQILAFCTAVMLTLPRMISGAHWASDIIFTIVYSMLWFNLAIIALQFFGKTNKFLNLGTI